MANNTAMYGFRHVAGDHRSAVDVECFVADAETIADDAAAACDLSPGDPVKLVTTGSVNLAKTTELVYGVVKAVLGVYDSANGTYGPSNRVPVATTGGGLSERRTRVLVTLAKGQVFEADCSAAHTTATEAGFYALINFNIDHICVRAARYGAYAAFPKLLLTSAAADEDIGWRIVGISKNAANKDFSGTNVKLLVMVNDSQEPASPATNNVGV
jgi:hypothetical protein